MCVARALFKYHAKRNRPFRGCYNESVSEPNTVFVCCLVFFLLKIHDPNTIRIDQLGNYIMQLYTNLYFVFIVFSVILRVTLHQK